MNSATKIANWTSHILPYAGVGGGAFALGALLNEVRRQRESEEQRSRQDLPPNSLVIDLPRQAGQQQQPKVAFYKQADGMLSNLFDHTAGGAIGLPVGFMGAKLLYDKYKKNQTDSEIDGANRKYLQALAALQQKNAEVATPKVDEFCKAAAETLEKQGFNPLQAFIPRLAHQNQLGPAMMSAVDNIGNAGKKVAPWLIGGTAAGLGVDALRPKATDGTLDGGGDLVKKLLASTAILSGLGTAGAMIHANNKSSRKPAAPPSAVALNYEDIPPAAALQ